MLVSPVKNGSSSPLVLSSPSAKAMVDSFLIEFRRNCAGERIATVVIKRWEWPHQLQNRHEK